MRLYPALAPQFLRHYYSTTIMHNYSQTDSCEKHTYMQRYIYTNYISSSTRLGSKCAKVDNRHLLGLCLIFTLVGSVLFGDWQSVGRDPCSSVDLSTSDFDVYISKSGVGSGVGDILSNITSTDIEDYISESVVSSGVGDMYSNDTLRRCEALSNSSHQCFWNPHSRITGEFCITCLSVCLSKQKSHNIFQFSLGVVLLALAGQLGFVVTSAIGSEVTSVDIQVCSQEVL